MAKKLNKANLFAALSMTTLIFLSGFYLNSTLTGDKLTELQELQDVLSVESASLEAQYDLALQNPCNIAGLTELNNELNSFGDKVTHLERISPDEDINVDNLYNYYTVLEVKHFLFINEVNQKCEDEYPTILFFYSLDDEACTACGEQGQALTALKHDYPNTMIYSFNLDSTSKVVGTLEQLYNITGLPALVVNEEKIEGFTARKELESTLEA